MRNYPIYDLTWQEFEILVVMICDKILGIGTINFSAGPDGGRDAKFIGKAQHFPSNTNPWQGKFIIQAKHTNKPTASCSDYDFTSALEKEIPKLKKLIDNDEMDYYLLFTNRKLSGNTDAQISNFIDSNMRIENCVIGDEKIQLWLKEYPDISRILRLNKLFIPLEFYEKDLKSLIIAFSEMKDELGEIVKNKNKQIKYLDKIRKNESNKLSREYFEFIKKNSLAYFYKIEAFLKDPINKHYKNFYMNTVSDLQGKILVKREEYYEFEKILEELFEYVFLHNEDLKNNRKLIRVFLHYMYWHCDIGIGA